MVDKTMVLLFVVAFSFFMPVHCVDQPLHVVVDGSRGNDTRQCLRNSHPIPCQSLSFVAQNLTQNNSVWIEISGELLNLRVPVEFTDYTNLRITGSERETTLHCNESEAGLAFGSVQNLTISSLSIENCGALRNSTSVNPLKPNETEKLNVAVYILNCTDVTIYCVDILSSNGTGLSLYDTNGVVNITHSNFIKNRVFNQSGGGGVHIEFTICTPGTLRNCFKRNGRNSMSRYIIQSCIFSLNAATYPSSIKHHSVILPTLNGIIPRLGRGGGLYISVGLDAQSNSFTVSGCSFLHNAASLVGGGMLVQYLNSVSHNAVSVCDTRFEHNTCLDAYISSGGGLMVESMLYMESHVFDKQPKNNSFLCDQCTFRNNTAYTGGGTAIVATAEHTVNTNNSIVFSLCSWRNNVAPLGAAVYISTGLWDFTVRGVFPVPLFIDCTIEYNSAYQELSLLTDLQLSPPMHISGASLKMMSVGLGAMFISELHVKFMGNSSFCGNVGSAVYLSNGVLEFCEGSRVKFHKNKGQNGGAIAMYESSVIRVSNGSSINFTENKAFSRGGAIYTEITATLHSGFQNCFVESTTRINKSSAVLRFYNNKAKVNGRSIFATSLRSCKIICLESKRDIPYNQLLNCTATFHINPSTISTPPKSFQLNESTPIHIKPGIKYYLNLSAYDERNSPVSGTIYEAIVNDSDVRADQQVSDNLVTVYGSISSASILNLDTSDISLPIDIILDECQPGYTFFGTQNSCKCVATEYLGLEGCDPKVYLTHGYWTGYCNSSNTTVCTSYCPYGFCSYHGLNVSSAGNYILPNNSSDLDSHVCGPCRTGPACGECVDGRSVYFHSWKYKCGSEELCDWGWLFYLLSEIVPLTFFFIIIIVFNINFTSGYLSTFVLFAQLLDSLTPTDIVQYSSPIYFSRIAFIFLYQVFNLNFFSLESLSFCLWKGATAMDVVLMKLTSVAFALVLVLTTIIIVGCRFTRCNIFSRFRTPTSVLIHGLSAFFVLCYSQSARAAFHILTYFCLYSNGLHCERTFVYRMGYMTYLEGEHIQYAVIAIFVLIFIVIIPPLLLLIYPLVFKLLGFCKLSESKLASVLWRVMPIQLLDAFQSSFKDEYRFFAAFYFIYRAIILGAFAYARTLTTYYFLVQLQLTVILAVHAIFQPYRRRKHNVIDAILFTNLAFINGITLYNFSEKSSNLTNSDGIINAMAAVQMVLISLPMLFLIVLGVARLKIQYKKWQSGDRTFDDLPSLRDDETQWLSYQKINSYR